MPDFSDIFKLTGLNAALWSTAVLLAVLLRIVRAAIHRAGDGTTVVIALVFAGFGTIIKSTAAEEWRVIAFDGLALLVTVLLLQYALAKASEKNIPVIGWLPKDNQWVTPPEGGTK